MPRTLPCATACNMSPAGVRVPRRHLQTDSVYASHTRKTLDATLANCFPRLIQNLRPLALCTTSTFKRNHTSSRLRYLNQESCPCLYLAILLSQYATYLDASAFAPGLLHSVKQSTSYKKHLENAECPFAYSFLSLYYQGLAKTYHRSKKRRAGFVVSSYRHGLQKIHHCKEKSRQTPPHPRTCFSLSRNASRLHPLGRGRCPK